MELKMTKYGHEVLAIQEVVVHTLHKPGQPCWGLDMSDAGCSYGRAAFLVNLQTGECKGRVEGDIVMVDPVWWEEHCSRVGARVRESYKDHVV